MKFELLKRLNRQLQHACSHWDWYARQVRQAGFVQPLLASADQVAQLPLLTRDDLTAQFPRGAIAAAPERLAELHQVGDLSNHHLLTAATLADREHQEAALAQLLTGAGLGPGDFLWVVPEDASATLAQAARGACARSGIRLYTGTPRPLEQSILLLRDLEVTALFGTVDALLHLSETMAYMGLDHHDLHLRAAFLLDTEGRVEETRHKVQSLLGGRPVALYALPDFLLPIIAWESPGGPGVAVAEPHYLAEIVDPESGQPLPDGKPGELVVSALEAEALPLLRYRTGLVSRVLGREGSACRLQTVRERVSELVVTGDSRIYPSQIEAILARFQGSQPQYQLRASRRGGQDLLEIKLEYSVDFLGLSKDAAEALRRKMEGELMESLAIPLTLLFQEPGELALPQGNNRRILRRR